MMVGPRQRVLLMDFETTNPPFCREANGYPCANERLADRLSAPTMTKVEQISTKTNLWNIGRTGSLLISNCLKANNSSTHCYLGDNEIYLYCEKN